MATSSLRTLPLKKESKVSKELSLANCGKKFILRNLSEQQILDDYGTGTQ